MLRLSGVVSPTGRQGQRVGEAAPAGLASPSGENRICWYVVWVQSPYWIDAQAGIKDEPIFTTRVKVAGEWAKDCARIRWFSDGERRYGKSLCDLASVYLLNGE